MSFFWDRPAPHQKGISLLKRKKEKKRNKKDIPSPSRVDNNECIVEAELTELVPVHETYHAGPGIEDKPRWRSRTSVACAQ